MKKQVEEKIDEKLSMYGFTRQDLTDEEMEALIAEAEGEVANGTMTIDGVLFNIDRYRLLDKGRS